MSRWLLVQRADAPDPDVERARALAAELGDGTELVATADTTDLDAAIDRLEGRTLVVCGGDGGVHLAVNRLAARDRLDEVTVGLLPAGTGNDLAHTLDLPAEPAAVAEVLRAGRVRRLDVLAVRADGRDRGLCVNALHTGVGVEAAERARTLKDTVGDFAYPLGSVAAGVAATGWSVEVQVDGQVVHPSDGDRVLMVAVANGRTIGGGRPLSPDADPGDGRADVLVSHAVGPAARAAFGVTLARGTHVDRDDVVVATGTRIVLRGELPGANVDGELWDEALTTLEVTVRPDALAFVVPATA